ncbi:MAG: hypothetical protein JST01_26120 [Cyanobacteria bacterium SZAS TMP-1]|nr:hypothetical protein [Cyanobacteria bacterium SZAS TMP-1]
MKNRIDTLKNGLSNVPPARLVDALVERTAYDLSLLKFLETLVQVGQPRGKPAQSLEAAKKLISAVYGADSIYDEDIDSVENDIKGAQAIVEQLFKDGFYAEVIELFDWSLQFEENISEVCEPDDFLDTAYMPLAILCLKSHLRLGKPPEVVAQIFKAMGEADEYGLFYKLGYLWPGDKADLDPVKVALGESLT